MNKFEKILLTIFFIELFVGGGGRLIDFGVLSIRQVLFLLILCTFAFRLLKHKQLLDKEVNTFLTFNITSAAIYTLIGWFSISAIVGILNGHAIATVAMDFLRVSFFLLYFPLAYYISEDRYKKKQIIQILKYSSLVIAVFTIIVSLVGKMLSGDSFAAFYNFMNVTMNDDLFFRPSHSVFYKGHFFVLMALLISLNAILNRQGTRLDIAVTVLSLISIIWSETRGFLLAIMFGMVFIVMMDIKTFTDSVKGLKNKAAHLVSSKFMLRKIAISLAIVLAVPFMYKYMTVERFGAETKTEQKTPSANKQQGKNEEEEINDVSVNARVEFILASKDLVLKSIPAFIIGSGYGTEIAGRDTGIEMSFLDILVEQGAIGLFIWLAVCLVVFYNYHMVYTKKGSVEASDISLLACIAALLLLTNINPFINNPLGIGFFLIVLVLSKNKKDSLQQARL